MFTGLSAFPLTPVTAQGIDTSAYASLIRRLALAGVDSIGALGSTGSYAYLDRQERAQAVRIAVEHAAGIPVVVGVGALSTRDVLLRVDDAQHAGAAGVLLSPMSYQKLTDDEVYTLYATVCAQLSVPLVVYDNPATTNFVFSDELHGRIARLPQVASIKIPPVSAEPGEARARVARLRALIPEHVTLGISGDALAVTGLNAGCDAWYSVVGGLFPEVALAITRTARSGDAEGARLLSERLAPLWQLYAEHGGSLRVIAAAAEVLGLVPAPCLPLPLKSAQGSARAAIADRVRVLELA